MNNNETFFVLIATPTPHNVYGPLKKQYGENISIRVLTQVDMITLTTKGVKKLTQDIKNGVAMLSDGQHHYYLLLTGHPLANQIAYEVIRQKYGDVGIISFSSRNKRYLAVPRLSDMVANTPMSDVLGGIESKEKQYEMLDHRASEADIPYKEVKTI